MPITLGLNLSSIKAQRQLARSSSQLSSVFERLSSGQRINRASDDAAGLAIAESLNSDARVFTQGIRNLNDGLSVLNVADGALSELSNITIRLAELAEQAANGVLGNQQRAALDEEAQALSDEYFRIVQSTEFNGRQLFTADYGELRLQAGFGLDGSVAQGLGGAVGTGEFSTTEIATSAFQAGRQTFGDFNGDGNLDIVLSDTGNDLISVFLGDGSGNFGSQQDYDVGGSPFGLNAKDLNNDGVLDLITTDFDDDTLSILLGNGDGTFQDRQTYATAADPEDVTFDDFDGDGTLDLVVADSVGITFHRGNGDGSFTQGQSFGGTPGANEAIAGDFNNDGIQDVIITGGLGIDLGIFIGHGDGTFDNAQLFTTNSLNPQNLEIADFNGDGNLDAVFADFNSSGYRVMLGNGDGTLQTSVAYNTTGIESGVTVGDFNADGILDFAGSGLGGITIFTGQGDGTFVEGQQISSGFLSLYIDSADIDNDGVEDLIINDANTDSIFVFTADTADGVAPLLDFSLTSIADAKQALTQFTQKIDQLSEQRGQLGAFQARIQVAENVLQVTTENYRAAESRIRDADIAQEAADLVRLQILQQAGASVLGQANLQPQLVLQLLGGGR